ncbi:MAG TPA: glutathione peroxidase [Pirellulales bacterium]|nr:glutathione peroxidase [Pirellulales bacterium]
MQRLIRSLAFAAAMGGFALAVEAADKAGDKAPSALSFKMKNLTGKDVDLSKYKGKVVLIVNVASYCGNTKQYAPLEKLHEKYADEGLAILGFPANEFGKQEPGTDEEIADFCEKNYGVKFDMFSKVVVKGEGKCPLYEFLTSKESNPEFGGDISWNFEKFLIGRDGKVVARFAPRVSPDSEQVVSAIEEQLSK